MRSFGNRVGRYGARNGFKIASQDVFSKTARVFLVNWRKSCRVSGSARVGCYRVAVVFGFTACLDLSAITKPRPLTQNDFASGTAFIGRRYESFLSGSLKAHSVFRVILLNRKIMVLCDLVAGKVLGQAPRLVC